MINVAIKEGWAGGPWHTQAFRQALQDAGYVITGPDSADVIIAHSTACYDLPAKTPARYYLLIGPPYWPGKSILKRLIEKKRHDSRLVKQAVGQKHNLQKTLHEGQYIFMKPKYTQLGLQNHDKLDFLRPLTSSRVVLVRNKDDYMCSPDIQIAVASYYKNVSYFELPGGHDDYYLNPQPYIALLPKAL